MALDIGNEDDKLLDNKYRIVATERKKIHEIFLHSVNPSPNDWWGTDSWAVTSLTNSEDCYFITKIPDDFKSLLEAAIVILPDSTETIQWDIHFQAARAGEDENSRGNNDLNVEKDVTIDTITEIDLTETTPGNPNGLIPYVDYLKPGDYFSVWFESDTTSLRVIGLRLKYVSE